MSLSDFGLLLIAVGVFIIAGGGLMLGVRFLDRMEKVDYVPAERAISVHKRPPLYDHERAGDFSGPRKFQLRVNECGHTWGRTHDGLCQGCGADWEQVHA